MNTMNNQRENSREKLSKIEGKWQKWNKPNQTKGKATETNRHVSKVKDKQSVICGSGDESRKGNSGTRFKLLNKYISERGKILSSRITGVSAKKQRKLSKAIKRARNLALLSFIEKNENN